jgi:hypothetical protein
LAPRSNHGLRLLALFGAGPALTATAAGLTLIVWKGGWDRALQAQQLSLLGWALLANWLLLGVVVAALASVKLKGQAPGGVEFEIAGEGSTDA